MTRATTRRHAAIAMSFGVQAVLIAAILTASTVGSAPRAQSARAVPAPVTQPPSAVLVPAVENPLGLLVTEQVGGGRVYTDKLPRGQAVPPYLVHVPAGMAEPVDITVTNQWSASVASVRLVIEPDSGRVDQGTQPTGHIFGATSKAVVPPGVTTFRFTVSAADLRPGNYPVIAMDMTGGQVMLLQLDPNGDG